MRPAIGIAFALLVALALFGFAFRLALRRLRARERRPRFRRQAPRYPVVLLHGVLGFDEINLGSARHAYFRGVGERLQAMGARVHRPSVPGSASVAERAVRVAALIREIDAARVNVIAHSMGGLDARYAISRLGLAHRVASLTTIGTPHLGTPIADLGTGVLDLFLIKHVLAPMIKLDAFYDLTTSRMAQFNREVRDAKQVAYASVVARTPPGWLHPLLMPAHLYLMKSGGASDGLVPVESQKWGEILREIEADHWAQIGWSPATGFDAPALFEEIARELRARGF